MPITAFYASLLVPLYILLAARTILMRFSARVSVGDGGDKELLRRMRVHANFAEYVPFALLLMGLAESLALDARLLHGVGIVLALGRYAHAYGMSRRKDILPLRTGGMIATLSVLIVLAASCFFLSMRRGFGL
ncbi:MAG: MAPEG family protein [Methylocystis sp.]